jgi:hypothetical protein
MIEWFSVHDVNPNDTVGGGGCMATGGRMGEDCKGPWINFFRVSTEFDASPHSVICAKHLAQVSRSYRKEELMAGGDELPRTGRVIRGTAVS